MGRLEGKRCVITGAGSGIGRAAALIFAREGGHVAALDLDEKAARVVTDEITGAGGRACAIACDVSSEDSVDDAIALAAQKMGGIDVCWANAGTGDSGNVVDTPLEHWEMVLRINLTGMFLTAKHAVPHMIEAGGRSLMLTSSAGVLSGVAGVVSNMSAKGGVLGLVRNMAADYAPRQIRVNAICPGSTITTALVTSYAKFDAKLGHPEGFLLKEATRNHPRGRLGEPEDIANVGLFLASDESTWVTAQFINVSGTGH